ncbi:MAG: hypothetical protein CM15mP40_10030 [Alphaproteobacteria bacterium]|nr:MAG: hypothetical protein CM15mP40_10030 [Alphaproteobacteria bacterium]
MKSKLIKIFRVKDFNQLIIIFIVFGITGSLSVVLGKYVLINIFGESFLNNDYYWLLRLILIFPIYQILLIIVGALFGQFRYFWEIEKKILIKMKLIKSTRS